MGKSKQYGISVKAWNIKSPFFLCFETYFLNLNLSCWRTGNSFHEGRNSFQVIPNTHLCYCCCWYFCCSCCVDFWIFPCYPCCFSWRRTGNSWYGRGGQTTWGLSIQSASQLDRYINNFFGAFLPFSRLLQKYCMVDPFVVFGLDLWLEGGMMQW